MISKPRMIQVPLTKRELREYVDGLADLVQNDTARLASDLRTSDVPRLWRKVRRFYIVDQQKERTRASELQRTDAELKAFLASYDRAMATVERLCPLLG